MFHIFNKIILLRFEFYRKFINTAHYIYQEFFGFKYGSIKSCMAEENITDAQVKAIENEDVSNKPDDKNACFFGCLMIKDGFVSRF